jgi:hypothetical protein
MYELAASTVWPNAPSQEVARAGCGLTGRRGTQVWGSGHAVPTRCAVPAADDPHWRGRRVRPTDDRREAAREDLERADEGRGDGIEASEPEVCDSRRGRQKSGCFRFLTLV